MICHCIITCSRCHDPISHNHMTLPTHISNPRPGPITLCYILVVHSTRHMSPLKCIAFLHSVMITPCSLVLSPLWFLCLMHSPHYMLPSICLCSLEHKQDGDQPADHMGLNHGKPRGMGQKIDPIHSICTQRIRIKGSVISTSMADIRDPFGKQSRHHLLPYQSISVGWAEKYKISFQLFE